MFASPSRRVFFVSCINNLRKHQRDSAPLQPKRVRKEEVGKSRRERDSGEEKLSVSLNWKLQAGAGHEWWAEKWNSISESFIS
jgi:hypothetical protein